MAIDAEAPSPPAEPARPPHLRLVPAGGFDREPHSATAPAPSHTAPVDVLAELERLLATELDARADVPTAAPRALLQPRVVAPPRFGRQSILALLALMGLLTTFVGHGTLAYFSSGVVGAANSFSGGVLDISGSLSGSTASVLPNASFSWTVTGASNGYAADGTTALPGGVQSVCRNLLSGADTGRGQPMVPGQFCVAPVDVNNSNAAAVDAWMRMRLYRATASGTPANEALNSRLRFFMHEYTGGTTGVAGTNKSTRDSDCVTSAYKPDATTSAGKIASGVVSTPVRRDALTSLGDGGKSVGTFSGDIYQSGALDSTNTTALSGTGLAVAEGGGAAPSEANMITASGASRTAFNLVGNDEVTNPVTGASAPNGSNPNGTQAEAQLNAAARRYYCAAIFFPSNTDITYAGASGDNSAQ